MCIIDKLDHVNSIINWKLFCGAKMVKAHLDVDACGWKMCNYAIHSHFSHINASVLKYYRFIAKLYI